MSTLELKELSAPAGEVIKIAAGKTLDLKSQGSVTMPSGSVIQVVNTNVQVSGANTGAAPSSTAGIELYSVSFTPLSSTSRIIVITSSVMNQELSNVGDVRWLGAWADTTQIGVNSATPHASVHLAALNNAMQSLNHGIDSWGTTAKTIRIRGGGDGAGYVNLETGYDYAASLREIGITIMEIQG